jgi:hypothetical protein
MVLAKRYPFSLASWGMAVMVLLGAGVWHLNVFDLPVVSVIGIERTEIGEVGIAFMLTIPAYFVDRLINRQRIYQATLRAEQIRVLQVTMRTVQDIVNNNLNQLQLLRLEAEGHVSAERLEQFDNTIQDTAAQLTAIGNMEVFLEKPMPTGSGLDVKGCPFGVRMG